MESVLGQRLDRPYIRENGQLYKNPFGLDLKIVNRTLKSISKRRSFERRKSLICNGIWWWRVIVGHKTHPLSFRVMLRASAYW